jgi:hypothetical protein
MGHLFWLERSGLGSGRTEKLTCARRVEGRRLISGILHVWQDRPSVYSPRTTIDNR